MKTLTTILFALLAIGLQAQTYVDPTYSGSVSTGSIAQPFNAIPVLKDSSIICLKAGTVLNQIISTNANNVTIKSYSTGAKPVINNAKNDIQTIDFSGNNCLLEGLDIRQSINSPKTDADGTRNIRFQNGSHTIKNCDIYGGHPSINTANANVITIIGCTIKNSVYDAYFGNIVNELIVKDTYMGDSYTNSSNPNMVSSIDLLHAQNHKKVTVDNCTFNHNSSGKYGIIHHGDAYHPYHIYSELTVTNSKFIGTINEACVFPATFKAVFDNCIFDGSKRAIQTPANTLIVKNCIIKNQTVEGVQRSGISQTFENCTFENVKNPILQSGAYIVNSKINGVLTNSGIKPAEVIIPPDPAIELEKYRAAWKLARVKATTRGYTFANFVKWMDSLKLK